MLPPPPSMASPYEWLDALPTPIAILVLDRTIIPTTTHSNQSIGITLNSFSACEYLNPAGRDWFGLSNDQDIRHDLLQRVHAQDRGRVIHLTKPTRHQEVLNSYLQTDYIAFRKSPRDAASSTDDESEPLVAHINQLNPSIDSLLHESHATSGTFITAWNPRSQSTDAFTNTAATAQLKEAIGEHTFFRHVGRSINGEWEEHGFFVLNWSRQKAREVAEQFQQNAVVYCVPNQPGELIWCVPDEPTSWTIDVRMKREHHTDCEFVRLTANPAPATASTSSVESSRYICSFSISPSPIILSPPPFSTSTSVSPTIGPSPPPPLHPTHRRCASSGGRQTSFQLSPESIGFQTLSTTTQHLSFPAPSATDTHHAASVTISSVRRGSVFQDSILTLAPSNLPQVQLPTPLVHSLLLDYWSVMPVMFCIMLDGRFVYTSQAFRDHLGWSDSELLSMHIRDIFHPADVSTMTVEAVRARSCVYNPNAGPPDSKDVQAGVASTSDPVVMNRLRHKSGEWMNCMFRTALSKSFTDAVDPYLKISESSSTNSHSSLSPPAAAPSSSSLTSISPSPSSSHVVEPYVYAMARPMFNQERSALSNALADVANQKAMLISNISHELQTPMNGIVASSEMLSQTELTAEQTDYLNCIQISAEHMSSIISDIISFASVDQGRLHLKKKPVHLTSVLEEAITLCFRPKQHDHLEILHTIAPDLPSAVLGDMARIRQVLVHALSNALKFTRAGHIQIRVSRYDGSEAPAQLLQTQNMRMQQLQDLVHSGALEGERLQKAEEELAAPPMLVIQPPTELPSLYHMNGQISASPIAGSPSASPPLQQSPSTSPMQPLSLSECDRPIPSFDELHRNVSHITEEPSPSLSDSSSAPPPPSSSAAPLTPANEGGSAFETPDGLATGLSHMHLGSIPPALHLSVDGFSSSQPFLLQFAIEDTGRGIDSRHSSRLFQIFSQADQSSSKEHAGTGIGLLTSLKLARAMHGDMWCSSITGRGSVFYFTIQVEPAPAFSPLQQTGSNIQQRNHTPMLRSSSINSGGPSSISPLTRVRSVLDREKGVAAASAAASTLASSPGTGGSSHSSVSTEFDSPASTSTGSSPHRSPLVFPRFMNTFQRVGVVDSSECVCDTLANDLRARGAAVRTFTSCKSALDYAESSTLAMDCWIIDAVSGTSLKSSPSAQQSKEAVNLPGEMSGVELVDQLLALRNRREKQKGVRATSTPITAESTVTSSNTSSSPSPTPEPELKVLLLVQSYGLPSSLTLSDEILQSSWIRLVQVHKPYKHQILYDAIRALAEQLVLPPSLGSTNPGQNSSYAVSLHAGKARRTLTLSMPMGDHSMSSAHSSGSMTGVWATRTLVKSHAGLNKISSGESSTPVSELTPLTLPAELNTASGHHVPHRIFLPVTTHSQPKDPSASHHSPVNSPIVPPSPFAHHVIPPIVWETMSTTPPKERPASDGTPQSVARSMTSEPKRGSAETSPSPNASAVSHLSKQVTPQSTPHRTRSLIHRPGSGSNISPLSTLVSVAARPQPTKQSANISTASSHRTKSTTSIAEKFPLKILLVEDHPVNMKIVLKVLSKLGYQPDTAVDGDEAQKKVCELARTTGVTYDVILMDLQMPVMDGFESSQIILNEFGCCNLSVPNSHCIHHTQPIAEDAWFKSLLGTNGTIASLLGTTITTHTPLSAPRTPPTYPHVPRPILMALTANTSEEDRMRCFKVGFDEFIPKPISIADLSVPLKKWGKRIQHKSGTTTSSKTTTSSTSVQTTTSWTTTSASSTSTTENTSITSTTTSSSEMKSSSNLTVDEPDSDSRPVLTNNYRVPSLRAMTSLDNLRHLDAAASSSANQSGGGLTSSSSASNLTTQMGLAAINRSSPNTVARGLPPPGSNNPNMAWPTITPDSVNHPANSSQSLQPSTLQLPVAGTLGLSPRVGFASRSAGGSSTLSSSSPLPPSSLRSVSRQLAHSSRVLASHQSPLLKGRALIETSSEPTNSETTVSTSATATTSRITQRSPRGSDDEKRDEI